MSASTEIPEDKYSLSEDVFFGIAGPGRSMNRPMKLHFGLYPVRSGFDAEHIRLVTYFNEKGMEHFISICDNGIYVHVQAQEQFLKDNPDYVPIINDRISKQEWDSAEQRAFMKAAAAHVPANVLPSPEAQQQKEPKQRYKIKAEPNARPVLITV